MRMTHHQELFSTHRYKGWVKADQSYDFIIIYETCTSYALILFILPRLLEQVEEYLSLHVAKMEK